MISVQRPALRELVLTRLRSFYREPSQVFWTFFLPILVATVLWIAFRSGPPQPAAVAVAEGPGAEPLRAVLDASSEVTAEALDAGAARAALRAGKVDLVVVPGARPVYEFDPTRPESRLARMLADDVLQRAAGRGDPVEAVEVKTTEPGSRYVDFLVPGIIGVAVMSSGLWGVGFAVVELRTKRLMRRFLATPMRRSDFLLSFLLSRACFLGLEISTLLAFGALVLDVPIRGSLALLMAVAASGALMFAGLGLLLASRAQNMQTAGGIINLVSVPMYLASGTFFSSSRFPDALQPLVRALPLTPLNDALRAVMLEGAGASEVLPQIATLLTWGAVSLAASVKLFRWE
ncbi:integral membrane transport protein [Sorangium cellulosum]|uniref:Transport permease protein n=1 Tax=Sorangium cellulosum TaxID=56 RepID=A0A150TMY0_SORCE|nr:integral membrane transport protein [Sorangium cellulosum]